MKNKPIKVRESDGEILDGHLRARTARILNKIVRSVPGVERCYHCGKLGYEYHTIRVAESPKDVDGIRVPVCKPCFWKLTDQ